MPIFLHKIGADEEIGKISIKDSSGNILEFARILYKDMNATISEVWIGFKLPIFTGSYAIFGDESKGYVELYSSGEITLSEALYDVFLVGGGGGGNDVLVYDERRGSGGGGGYTKSLFNMVLVGNYNAAIGAGGNRSKGGSTIFDNNTSLGGLPGAGKSTYKGGNGGSGGASYDPGRALIAGTDGGDAQKSSYISNFGIGQGTTTKPFDGDATPFDTMPLAGGGANGTSYQSKGGHIGGGDKGVSGTPNTGGGGGGGGKREDIRAGSGGSGIIIIRWGDWSTGLIS